MAELVDFIAGHVDRRDPRLRARPARRRRAPAVQRRGARRPVRRGGPADLPPRPAQDDLLRRRLARRALRGRRAQRRARSLPRRRLAVRRPRRRDDHRVRHPRPVRVLLPLRPRAPRPGVRLHARDRGARHVGGAELLRARRGDRPRRRAHLPADRRRRLRGQPGDVRLRGRRAGREGGRPAADAVARHGRAHAAVHVRADALVGAARVGAARARHGLRRRRRHDRVRGGDADGRPLRAAADRARARVRRPGRREPRRTSRSCAPRRSS